MNDTGRKAKSPEDAMRCPVDIEKDVWLYIDKKDIEILTHGGLYLKIGTRGFVNALKRRGLV